MINMTRIKELRAFKSLRAVTFDTKAYGVHVRPERSNVLLDWVETMAISEIGGEHSPVTELVRQRPGLRYTIDIHRMQSAESIGLSSRFVPSVSSLTGF